MQEHAAVQKALIIDDAKGCELVERMLRETLGELEIIAHDPTVEGAPAGDFPWFSFDLLILEYELGIEQNGIDWLCEHKREGQFPAVVMLTGAGNEEIAVRAIKSGAHDYLSKRNLTQERFAAGVAEALRAHEQEIADLHSITQQGASFNKALFYVRLESAARSVSETEGCALLIVQLDTPEVMQECLGIIGFDNLMRHVAKLSFSQLRKRLDLPSLTQYGDSCVAVLVHNIRAKREAEAIAKRICARLDKATYRHNDKAYPFTVSIGSVLLQQQSLDAQTMLDAASAEVREASRISGNSFQIREAPIDAQFTSSATATDGDVPDLAAAVAQNRLVCYYHPITPVTFQERMSGWEFFDVNVSLIGANGQVFDTAKAHANGAEDDPLRMLDRWAVRECMGRLLELRQQCAERQVQLFLNVNAPTLADVSFEPWLESLLEHMGESNLASSLALQFTPEALATTKRESLPLLNNLRDAKGFRFTLCNVLTTSVLDHCLGLMRFDYVKLSTTITCTEQSADGRADVATAIVARAQDQQALTIAQDIDDAARMSRVLETGVDLVAGHFVGAPQTEIGPSPAIESMELTDVSFA